MAVIDKFLERGLTIARQQLSTGQPPQAKKAYEALKKRGYSDEQAEMEIAYAVVEGIIDQLESSRVGDESKYLEYLEMLIRGESGHMTEEDEEDYSDEQSDHLWQDLDVQCSIDELRELANDLSIRTKKMDKEEIARAVAAKLLEPELMKLNFIHMSDPLAEKIDSLMEDGYLLFDDDLLELFRASFISSVYFRTGMEEDLLVAKDVQAVYKAIRTTEFEAARREWNWTFLCLVTFILIYGAGPSSAYAELYNTHPQLSVREEDVFDQLDILGNEARQMYFRNNDQICAAGLRKNKAWRKLLKQQGDLPFAKLPYEEIRELGIYMYPFSDPDWTELRTLLDEENFNADPGQSLMGTMYHLASLNADAETVFDCLADYGVITYDPQTDRLVDLWGKLVRKARFPERRGNTNPDAEIDIEKWHQQAERWKDRMQAIADTDDELWDECPF